MLLNSPMLRKTTSVLLHVPYLRKQVIAVFSSSVSPRRCTYFAHGTAVLLDSISWFQIAVTFVVIHHVECHRKKLSVSPINDSHRLSSGYYLTSAFSKRISMSLRLSGGEVRFNSSGENVAMPLCMLGVAPQASTHDDMYCSRAAWW